MPTVRGLLSGDFGGTKKNTTIPGRIGPWNGGNSKLPTGRIGSWYNAPPASTAQTASRNPAAITPVQDTYTAPRPAAAPANTNLFSGQQSSFTPSATTNPASGGAPTGSAVTNAPSDQPWSMGGTSYSPTDLQTMLNNPYVFAQEWLKGRGMDNPTMLARLGNFPEAAAPLIFMLLGDKPVGSTLGSPTSASQFRRLLYQQTDPNQGGINAKQLINKLLSYGAGDTKKDLLGAALGSGTPNEQVQFLNDLLNVSTVNASPYFANPLKQALSYLGNSYLGAQLDANKGQDSYSEWLRKNGLFGVVQ